MERIATTIAGFAGLALVAIQGMSDAVLVGSGVAALGALLVLMVFGALILRPQVNRIANIALSVVYSLTIIGGAIGAPA